MKAELEIKMDGYNGKFITYPMPLSKGLELCRKVELMVLKALKALDTLKEPIIQMVMEGDTGEASDDDFVDLIRKADINGIMDVLIEVFHSMSTSEFIKFVQDILSSTKYIGDTGAVEFRDTAQIDAVFAGNIVSVYQIMFKVMEYNEFTPFAKGGIGSLMDKIGFSPKPDDKDKPSVSS